VKLDFLEEFDVSALQQHMPQRELDSIVKAKSKHSFEVNPCDFDRRMSNICKRFKLKDAKPIYSYNAPLSENVESQLNFSEPIIYTADNNQTSDDLKSYERVDLTTMGFLGELKQSTNRWVCMTVSVCGGSG
jgi:hypothetical protein